MRLPTIICSDAILRYLRALEVVARVAQETTDPRVVDLAVAVFALHANNMAGSLRQ